MHEKRELYFRLQRVGKIWVSKGETRNGFSYRQYVNTGGRNEHGIFRDKLGNWTGRRFKVGTRKSRLYIIHK